MAPMKGAIPLMNDIKIPLQYQLLDTHYNLVNSHPQQ